MSILKRLHGTEDDGNAQPRKPRKAPPEIIRGRPGYASFSMSALAERIEAQLQQELGDRYDILLEARDASARRDLVREAGEYVLAVESVPLNYDEKEALFEGVYRNLFSFGPLDALLEDDDVTDLAIDGPESIHLRRRLGELEQVVSFFEDYAHLRRITERIVTGAGGQLLEEVPFIEVGCVMLGRPVRLTLVGPPLSPVLHLDVRLHPREAATIAGLKAVDALTDIDEVVLRALVESRYGTLIVADAAGGKTTLLEALLSLLPHPESCWLVERARELRLPPGLNSRYAIPATTDSPGVTFAEQIAAVLKESPGMLIADELRGDEAVPVWQALQGTGVPRVLFLLRSSADPRRLRNAFSILIRKGQPNVAQEIINQVLLDRLPFVVTTTINHDGLRVTGISEWAPDAASGDVTLRSLVRSGALTGEQPLHALPLSDGFWQT